MITEVLKGGCWASVKEPGLEKGLEVDVGYGRVAGSLMGQFQRAWVGKEGTGGSARWFWISSCETVWSASGSLGWEI